MRRFGMSPAALVIALVLGPMAEETLRQTMIISDGSFGIFLERTTSVVLLSVMAFIVLVPLLAPKIRRAVRRRLAAYGRRRAEAKTAREDDRAGV